MTGALDSWRARALEEVTLPSGMQARIRKPRTDELLRAGGLPPDLRQAVMKVYSGSTKLEELEEEQLRAFLEQQDRLIASMVRELRADDEADWEPVELTVDDMAALPPDDVEALKDIGNRSRSVEAITARSLMQRELLSRAKALAIEEEAKPGTIPGWTDFRDGQRGAEPGADGAGVAPVAIGDPSPRRDRRRARARG
jgi:hypothetical protein